MKWLLRSLSQAPKYDSLAINAGSLELRPPVMADFAQWAALRAASRAFLEPWEPAWPADDLTEAAFRARLQRNHAEIAQDSAYPFFIHDRESGTLLGGITLSNVRRRAAQSASLGYWMGAPHAGRGIMSRAVAVLSETAFSHFELERLEAACLPGNAASIRVLEKAGFRREGFARAYLAIAGERRDHLLFGLIRADLAARGRVELVQRTG